MITVVGSFVVDLMSRTPHMPVAGESVLGGPFKMGPGGKGGNQCIAAARCGSQLNMVTRIGKDEFGEIAKRSFTADHVNLDYTVIDENESTGVALIIVDDHSENMIVVATGACGKLSREDVLAAEEIISKSDVLLTQLETSIESIRAAIELAGKYNVPVVLNPAPYSDFPKDILENVTYATPNETEASYLSGVQVVDDASAVKAAAAIKEMGVNVVIITMGSRGCLVYEGPDKYQFVSAFHLDNVVDTTGAGDAFNGGFAHAISVGMPLYEAVRFGNAVAGLSVTKVGTAPSMPYIEDTQNFLQEHAE